MPTEYRYLYQLTDAARVRPVLAASGWVRGSGRAAREAREREVSRRVRRLISDELWRDLERLIPLEAPKPRGGRPRASARAALAGIVHVLRTGSSWATLPKRLGFGSGMTCWRRLREWQGVGVWPEMRAILLRELPGGERLPWERLEAPPPSPVRVPPARNRPRTAARGDSTAFR